jgi:uroporphyrinogen decarboxylase
MTSKERVLRNYRFQTVDRFSIDFCAESKVYARLRDYFGVPDDLALMEKLHVDFRYPKPKWIGFPLIDEQGRTTDYFGIPRGGEGDFGYALDHPLAHVQTVAEVEAYAKWPTPDMWDYDQYAEDCAQFEQYAVLGGAWGWFFEAACELVGMDRFFLLIADKPEVAHAILQRIVRFMERTSEIMFEKAGRYIDICFTGDDYGFQNGPMMSPRMFAEFVRPYLQRIYDVGRRNGKLVMHHSCGSVARWIPTFLEMGLNILEPVQVRAAGMDVRELASNYGGKLCFHGSIDTQQTLPFGTPEDVRRQVRERVATFKPYGGFTIAPSQHLMTDIPIENIVAMYETAYEG